MFECCNQKFNRDNQKFWNIYCEKISRLLKSSYFIRAVFILFAVLKGYHGMCELGSDPLSYKNTTKKNYSEGEVKLVRPCSRRIDSKGV